MLRTVSTLGFLLWFGAAAASDPASHDVTVPSAPGEVVVEWTGTALAGANATSDCTLPSGVATDDHHTVNLTVPDGIYADLQVKAAFRIEWEDTSQDLILTLNQDGAFVASSDGGDPAEEVAVTDPLSASFETVACAFAATANTPYTGRLTVTVSERGAGGAGGAGVAGGPPQAPPEFPPAPADAPRYTIFTPPTPLGEDSGEPSIGYNKATGRAMYIAGLQTLRATFPENLDPPLPESCEAQWDDVSYILTATASLDPILYTDPYTNRTFVSQLRSVSPPVAPVLVGANSYFAFTDDDGETWSPGQLDVTNGSYDHQTVGAGPYPAPLNLALATPQNLGSAVYYCSQTGVAAECARSDDGGLTFNPPAVVYNLTDCSGIHGHVRVAPDGTAFLPNRSCGGNQAIVVSEDAGTTWDVRRVPTSTSPPAILDPSYAIATDSMTGYLCYVDTDGRPHVATTHDQGLTWDNDTDVGAQLGLKKAVFVEAIAGDPDRAACGFVGSTTDGDHESADFPGAWYLFIAHTYDGGESWVTVNANPNDPVQIGTGIWNSGGAAVNRNLLDFNEIALDERGRVLYAFADGCIGDCVPAGPNSFSSKANIARQSGGKPLLAEFDQDFQQPVAPKQACLAGRRDDLGSYLTWRKPDSGGAPISGYDIYRSTDPGGPFEAVGHAGGGAKSYIDRSATADVGHYYYKVVASNVQGSSDFSNPVDLEVGPRPVDEGPCVLPGELVIQAPTGDATIQNDAFDITAVSVAEPPGKLDGKLVFTLKVVGLDTVPPGWRWAVRLVAPTPPPPDALGNAQEDYFVSMLSSDGVAPTFTYGTTGADSGVPSRIFTTIGDLDEGSGYNVDGTITLVIDKAKLGSPQPGEQITAIYGSVRASAPSAAPGSGGTNETIPDATSGSSYTLRAPNFCLANTPPVARLQPDVDQGTAPLTVTFDASASADPDMGVDEIASYSFNFGDGSEEVEQSSPYISYTYTENGLYPAQVIVHDSRGKASANVAKAVIVVGDTRAEVPGLPEEPLPGAQTIRGGAPDPLLLMLGGLVAALRRRRT